MGEAALPDVTLPASTLADQVISAMRVEFPKFRMVAKDRDRLSHLIDKLLKICTLGGQNTYLSQYHTVIGHTLYLPTAWARTSDADRAITLRHERVHLRQRRRYGFALMAFFYLVPFFPVGLAYGRARLEWEAYAETLRATAEIHGIEAAHAPALRERIVGRFLGPDYGWMWPFRRQVERWYDAVLRDLDRDLEQRPRRVVA